MTAAAPPLCSTATASWSAFAAATCETAVIPDHEIREIADVLLHELRKLRDALERISRGLDNSGT